MNGLNALGERLQRVGAPHPQRAHALGGVDLVAGQGDRVDPQLAHADRDLAEILRKSAKPVFYVINKIDGEKQEAQTLDFYPLGVENLYPISAEHGRGVGDLMDEVLKGFPPSPPEERKGDEAIRVALVGRPNVGKSSLLNRLLGRSRAPRT